VLALGGTFTVDKRVLRALLPALPAHA
jgi:hypothetical protein